VAGVNRNEAHEEPADEHVRGGETGKTTAGPTSPVKNENKIFATFPPFWLDFYPNFVIAAVQRRTQRP
jgi:hypothetical protein